MRRMRRYRFLRRLLRGRVLVDCWVVVLFVFHMYSSVLLTDHRSESTPCRHQVRSVSQFVVLLLEVALRATRNCRILLGFQRAV